MLHNKVAYIQNPSVDKTCTRILKVNGYHHLKVEKDLKLFLSSVGVNFHWMGDCSFV
jgi:hypothetical protein